MYSDDSALVQACLKGDEAAWKEFVQRYARLIFSIALHKGLSRDDADDVVQNVFTLAYRRLESLRDQKLVAAWLITTTHRECSRIVKRFPNELELDESLADDEELSLDELEIMEYRYVVRAAIDRLEPSCRELLTALFLEAPTPSYQEIAGRLGIATGSIGPTRARCFEKLEKLLIEMGFEPKL